MKRILQTSFLIACLAMLGAKYKTRELCEGFVPENHLNIPVGLTDDGITQDEWTALFDKYEKIYTPIITSRGGKLQLNRLWDDGTVNANASEADGVWTINMYGGLARYPTMNVDGMTLVVCHETGHHLGGAPRWYDDPTQWAANEGGADYFATLKCAHHMFADDDNISIVSKLDVDPIVKTNCDAQYSDANESAICQRTATAGVLLGRLLGNLSEETVIPGPGTPDQSVADQTITDGYPGTQCRLDTYVAGALCKADISVFQNNDYHTGTCTNPEYTVGVRPACWFNQDKQRTDGGGNGKGNGNGKHNS